MHELNITKNILDVALAQAQLQAGELIQRLHITLDPNSGYSAESIRFYFDELARNSAAANAELAFAWSESGSPIRLTQVDIADIATVDSSAEASNENEQAGNEQAGNELALSASAHWQLDLSNPEPSATYLDFIDQLLAELSLRGHLHLGASHAKLEIDGPRSQLAHFCHHLRHDAPSDSAVDFSVAELSW